MSTRLYVGNLSFNTTEQAVRDAFSQIGEVTEAKLISDRDTGRSRGFAFVTMAAPDDARRAIAELDGSLLDGRPLRVNEAEERKSGGGGGGGGGGGRFDGPRGGGGGGKGGRGGRDRRSGGW